MKDNLKQSPLPLYTVEGEVSYQECKLNVTDHGSSQRSIQGLWLKQYLLLDNWSINNRNKKKERKFRKTSINMYEETFLNYL